MSRITAAEVAAALEIANAAYQEAMTRAGMLAGKIAEVHAWRIPWERGQDERQPHRREG